MQLYLLVGRGVILHENAPEALGHDANHHDAQTKVPTERVVFFRQHTAERLGPREKGGRVSVTMPAVSMGFVTCPALPHPMSSRRTSCKAGVVIA